MWVENKKVKNLGRKTSQDETIWRRGKKTVADGVTGCTNMCFVDLLRSELTHNKFKWRAYVRARAETSERTTRKLLFPD
jgi:hypothetical protein